MMAKIDVNGANSFEGYQFLRESQSLDKVPHNFAKFLLDSEGQVVKFYKPGVAPVEILPDIKKLLK